MGNARAAAILSLLVLCLPAAAGGPAQAQMLGPLMSQMAGPFAGRMGALGPDNMAPYGSPMGAAPHIMQGTQALMNPAMSNTVSSASQPDMGSSNRTDMAGSNSRDNMKPRARSGGNGEKKGGDAPDADVGEGFWRVMVGACAGGAFIGGFAVAPAAPAAAPAAAAAAPAAVTGFLSALGVGCVLGGATAATSLGAVWVYRELGGP